MTPTGPNIKGNKKQLKMKMLPKCYLCPLLKGTAADLCNCLSHCVLPPNFKMYLKWVLFRFVNYVLWTNLDCLFGPTRNILLCFGEASFLIYCFFNSAAVNWKGKQDSWGDLGLICRRRKREKCYPSLFFHFLLSYHVKHWRGSQVTRTQFSSPPDEVQRINVHLFLLGRFHRPLRHFN